MEKSWFMSKINKLYWLHALLTLECRHLNSYWFKNNFNCYNCAYDKEHWPFCNLNSLVFVDTGGSIPVILMSKIYFFSYLDWPCINNITQNMLHQAKTNSWTYHSIKESFLWCTCFKLAPIAYGRISTKNDLIIFSKNFPYIYWWTDSCREGKHLHAMQFPASYEE